MKMKIFDHETFLSLNGNSIQAGRSQNLGPEKLPSQPQEHYWVNAETPVERDGAQDIRLSVVMNLFKGQTAWLDVSKEEFEAIPEVEISDEEWETAMCAGSPPTVR